MDLKKDLKVQNQADRQPLIFAYGKCDVCGAEGPVAYIRQLDRFYCHVCLETAAQLIREVGKGC